MGKELECAVSGEDALPWVKSLHVLYWVEHCYGKRDCMCSIGRGNVIGKELAILDGGRVTYYMGQALLEYCKLKCLLCGSQRLYHNT